MRSVQAIQPKSLDAQQFQTRLKVHVILVFSKPTRRERENSPNESSKGNERGIFGERKVIALVSNVTRRIRSEAEYPEYPVLLPGGPGFEARPRILPVILPVDSLCSYRNEIHESMQAAYNQRVASINYRYYKTPTQQTRCMVQ